MREKNTGVSGVTNRMELVQRLRNNLVKSRLTSMVLGIVVAILVVTVTILAKELKDAKQMINHYSELEITLNHEINELKEEVKESKASNSFKDKIEAAMNIEDTVREAVSDIKYTTNMLKHKTKSGRCITTDLKATNYVLDKSTGEVVKVIENKQNIFVVYRANKKAANELEKELTKEYYNGLERYRDVIDDHDNTLLVKHEKR